MACCCIVLGSGEWLLFPQVFPRRGNLEPYSRLEMRRIQLISLKKSLERAKGFEPSTPTLARSCSILYRRNHECPEGWLKFDSPLDLRTRRAARRDASKKPD